MARDVALVHLRKICPQGIIAFMKRTSDGHPLRVYLGSMSHAQQQAYAARAGTKLGYLRKFLSVHDKPALGVKLVERLATESGDRVRFADLRPDVNWAEVRRALNRQHRKARSRA